MTVAADAEDIVRYARPTDVDGARVNGSAFVRRPSDTNGLSANRPAVFGEGEAALAQIRAFARIAMKPSGRLARLNVGRMRAKVEEGAGLMLSVIEDALEAEELFPADPSHALVKGLPAADDPFKDFVGDLISEEVEALHPTQ